MKSEGDAYKIRKLSDELVFIQWYITPALDSGIEKQFLQELQRLLDESAVPVYFISDLRRGRIVNIQALQQLGELTLHKNWAGSTAFSKDPITSLFVRSFKTFAWQTKSRNEMQATPEEALSFIASLKPGITDDVDWDAVLRSR